MMRLPPFRYRAPRTIADAARWLAESPAETMVVAGGTDLLPNMKRRQQTPGTLIGLRHLRELQEIRNGSGYAIGGGVTLGRLIDRLGAGPAPGMNALRQAALQVATPQLRNMGTVGGNLCLDTRCIFYNQSEWWRRANNHCLKTTGEVCHVAPKSRGVCFATFSGDLAPALMTLGAEVDLAGPEGRRTLPLQQLYIGHARHDGSGEGDGKRYLALRPGEVVTAVRAGHQPGLRSGYDKLRIRRSIEYPVAGVAVALRREGNALADLRVGITGTNPRPVLVEGTEALCGGGLDDAVLARLDAMIRDQVMSMKTTFTPGHYRRRVAMVLARRLARRLFEAA